MKVTNFSPYWDSIAALPMLLALETQLRPAGAALGPGEVLFSLWLLPVIAALIWRAQRLYSRQFMTLAAFWATLAAALSLGVIVASVREISVDWSLVIHDVAAYVLLALLTCVFTALPNAYDRLYRIQWMIALLGAALFLMQLGNAYGLFSLAGIDPWYWDRMRGWSENPNQFALLCLLTGFAALALADRRNGVAAKLVAFTCSGIALWTGLQSKSNAYSAVVIAGILLLALLKAVRAILKADRTGAPATALSLAGLSAIGLALTLSASVVDFRAEFQNATGAIARKGEDESADAALRLQLWEQSLSVGTHSWGLGLGPGPHLEIPPSIIAGRQGEDDPINLTHPKPGLAPNFEAHNTILELFVQGGVMAVAAFVAIVVLAISRAWKSGHDGLIALLFALVAFGSFHVIFRHPFVWFAICLALVSESHSRLLQPADSSDKASPDSFTQRLDFPEAGRFRAREALAVRRS